MIQPDDSYPKAAAKLLARAVLLPISFGITEVIYECARDAGGTKAAFHYCDRQMDERVGRVGSRVGPSLTQMGTQIWQQEHELEIERERTRRESLKRPDSYRTTCYEDYFGYIHCRTVGE